MPKPKKVNPDHCIVDCTSPSRPLVIYHGGCRDGFCAAWVCKRALEEYDPEFFPALYGQSPPFHLITNKRDVVIVDFSYPLDHMEQIAFGAGSLLVLDHHKSAQITLKSFVAQPPLNTRIVFDMNQSGAGLACSNYFPDKKRSFLVDYVEDRDLWRFALPDSKTINAYISILPFDFKAWDEANAIGEADLPSLHTARIQGKVVEAKIASYVREVREISSLINFEGYEVPIVNAAPVDISELLHVLCEGYPFALGWFQRKDGDFNYSLRSSGDFDVSKLARKFGGGGHKHAAGFESSELIHNY